MATVEQLDHDAIIELKGQVAALNVSIEAHNVASVERDTRIEVAVVKIEEKVGIQNGRVAKLESWKTQVTAIYGAILFSAPFTFYALMRIFGQ